MLGTILPAAALPAAAMLSLVALYAARAGVFAPLAEAAPALAAADTLSSAGPLAATTFPPDRPRRHSVTLPTLTAVEDLLDCLEADGVAGREVSVTDGGGFTVSWA